MSQGLLKSCHIFANMGSKESQRLTVLQKVLLLAAVLKRLMSQLAKKTCCLSKNQNKKQYNLLQHGVQVCALRVVAKEIVSQLRFSLSRSPFFVRDLEQKFVPYHNTINVGLSVFVFTRWQMQHRKRTCEICT